MQTSHMDIKSLHLKALMFSLKPYLHTIGIRTRICRSSDGYDDHCTTAPGVMIAMYPISHLFNYVCKVGNIVIKPYLNILEHTTELMKS
jgi:hypothetical protein